MRYPEPSIVWRAHDLAIPTCSLCGSIFVIAFANTAAHVLFLSTVTGWVLPRTGWVLPRTGWVLPRTGRKEFWSSTYFIMPMFMLELRGHRMNRRFFFSWTEFVDWHSSPSILLAWNIVAIRAREGVWPLGFHFCHHSVSQISRYIQPSWIHKLPSIFNILRKSWHLHFYGYLQGKLEGNLLQKKKIQEP